MNLTFKGFMRAYCRELTGLQTDSLRRLCAAASGDAPAAAEAVFVFAAVQGKEKHLLNLAAGTWMEAAYERAAEAVAAQGDIEAFLRSRKAPERFRKIWKAYEARRGKARSDRHVIALMRENTMEALEKSGMTIYRLCCDLSLNKGNLYAYLNKADTSKVSRATARRVMEYALASASA